MVSDAKLVISDSRVISHGDRSKGLPRSEIVPWSERVHPAWLRMNYYMTKMREHGYQCLNILKKLMKT